MSTKAYYSITAVIFLAIAVLHLARIAYGWPAVIGGVSIPVWVSWFGVVIAAYLSYRGFTGKERLSKRKK